MRLARTEDEGVWAALTLKRLSLKFPRHVHHFGSLLANTRSLVYGIRSGNKC